MEKKNTGLVVLVIILSVLVVALGCYIVYEKLTNTNNIENNGQNNAENNEVIVMIREKFEFAYDYFEYPNTYCNTDDYQFEETPNDDNGYLMVDEIYYIKSYQFKSYNELLNYLKRYMTEDVFMKNNSISKELYIEKDGELYCKDLGKGSVYQYGDTTINVESNDNNNITAVATKELIGPDGKEYDKIKIKLEKINNNWIITSYEEQD